ncbi:unnamed protein product [Adineta ricciae]|uniref:CCHC-type domain-containing protein n=1 Tax=Adineta ricciae TaxID=249248 RepID=A0A814G500_ADIRI|nr:unnamed protein product [Adineta ricciae]CAF1336052.1 unnamed protein product [Adineta ricciae]
MNTEFFSTPRTPRNYQNTFVCYNCNQSGHKARDCHKDPHRLKQCFQCHRYGHIAQDCTMPVYQFQYTNNTGKSMKNRKAPASQVVQKDVRQTNVRSSSDPNTQTRKSTIKQISPGQCTKARRGNRYTQLEVLANELFCDIFQYLSIGDLLKAFYELNSRFKALVLSHSCLYHLDFDSISKSDSITVFQRHIPLVKSRIVSVRVSDRNYAMKQTKLLVLHGLNLRNFDQLRSFTLCHVRCEQTMDTIMLALSRLSHVTHLKIIKCHSSFNYQESTKLSNIIWSLPKLTRVYLDTEQYKFYCPEKRSLSLEYVTIVGHRCLLHEIARLLTKTPRLCGLSIRHCDLNDNQFFSAPVLSITTLKLYDIRSRPILMNLLQTMNNLHHLTVETFYNNFDGYQWEEIITHYLPKLRVFRLKMDIQYIGIMNNEEQTDILLDSFRSHFWLDERQWFVRCHRKLQLTHSDILLYTVPLLFKNITIDTMCCPYKSTCPTDNI